MNIIKFFSAIFLFIASTCVNAVIVEGNFKAWVGSDESDEGVWSKNLWGSKVTGAFWYDTELAPAPFISSSYPSSTSYRSQTNSWLNLVFSIDGKTIDISNSAGNNLNLDNTIEGVNIETKYDGFGIQDQVMEGDFYGDFTYVSGDIWMSNGVALDHNSLEQKFTWTEEMCCTEVFFVMHGRNNGVDYRSNLEMVLTDFNIMTRAEATVPEPSSFSLILLGIFALAFRRRA